jgi:hypothetical protein
LAYLYVDIIQGFRYAWPIGQFYQGVAMVFFLYFVRDFYFLPKDKELLKLNRYDVFGISLAVAGYWFFSNNFICGMMFLWLLVIRFSYVGFNDTSDIQHFNLCFDEKNCVFHRAVDAIRNPFQVKTLPLLAWLAKYWFTYLPVSKYQRRYRAKIARCLFVSLKKQGFQQHGKINFTLDNEQHTLIYNAANTAFQSLYLDRYKSGYENEVAILLDHLVRPTDCFYDVGANYGYFSLFVASNPGYKGTIHAFELVKRNFQDLQAMTDIPALKKRIVINNIGIYSKADTIKILSGQQLKRKLFDP